MQPQQLRAGAKACEGSGPSDLRGRRAPDLTDLADALLFVPAREPTAASSAHVSGPVACRRRLDGVADMLMFVILGHVHILVHSLRPRVKVRS